MQKTVSNDDSFIHASSERRPPRRTKITDVLVRKVRSESAAFAIWDTCLKGFCLRVQPTGQKSYKVVYSWRGQPRWYHIGDAQQIKLKAARNIGAEILLRVARGEDPVALKRADREGKTFEQVFASYLKHAMQQNKKSWDQTKYHVERHAMPAWKNLLAKDIARPDVRSLFNKIEKRSMANAMLAHTSAVFQWAVNQEIIPANPCTDIESHSMEPRSRALSDTELREFLLALKREGTVQAHVLTAAAFLGQRIGEICHMRREHIDPTGWWVLPGQRIPALGWNGTKNGDDNHVWLPQPVRELIGDGATGFAFTNGNGGPVSKVNRLMGRICKEIGIEHATPHDLRRTHQTLLAQCGQRDRVIDLIANHRMKKIRRTYNRCRPSALVGQNELIA
jgi:integrase